MNLLKKISTVAITATMALTLAACGNSTNNESSNVAENAGSTSSDKPTLHYVDIGTPPKDLAKVNEKINEHLDEAGADYHLELTFWDWGDYEQKLQLASNTGEDWDLAFSASWAGPYETMVEKGAFLDITDKLDKDGASIKDKLSEDVIKGAEIDGKLYGIPGAAETVVAGDYFVWNKQFVDKYNIPYEDVRSLDDLEPYLKEVKEGEETVEYPLAVANDWGIVTTPVPQYTIIPGIAVKEDNGKLKAYNQFADEEYKQEIDAMKKFMDEGYINPSAPQTEAGQKYEGNSWLVTKAEGDPSANAVWKDSFGTEVVSYPIGENVLISNEKAQGKLVSINSQSKYPDQAFDFINRMFDDEELQRILCYGIEGEHYELQDGKVQRTDNYMNYDVPAFTFIAADTQTPKVGQPTKGEADYDVAVKDYKSKLLPSPVLGFTLDREQISSEISNVQQTFEEYKKNIQTGAFDDSYYEDFLKKLDDAGINKIVEETQKQLDNWQK